MEISAGTDPFTLFQSWYDDAARTEINDPDAMAIASVDKEGMPSVRMVLLRGWSPDGFLFFTNYESRKSDELLTTGKAAFCIHWKSQRRQVRVVGAISKATAEQSDEYFSNRPLESKLGAIISNQSSVIPLDYDFIAKIEEYKSNNSSTSIIRPENWGGFIIKINLFEFWQGRPSRLHDRLCYNLENGKWNVNRKSP